MNKSSQPNKTIVSSRNADVFQTACQSVFLGTDPASNSASYHPHHLSLYSPPLSPDFPIILIFYPLPLTFIFIPLDSALVRYLPNKKKAKVHRHFFLMTEGGLVSFSSLESILLYNSDESVSSMSPD